MKTDIQNAVNAGKVVTVSKTNINFNGWSGCGYVITNPETGAGAYMISGGSNGAYLFLLWASVFLFVCVFGSLGPLALIVAVVIGALVNLFGSQTIKIAFGLQNSNEITMKSLLLGSVGIIAAIALGAGLLALSAAAVSTAVFALLALILYATAGGLDFLLFWCKKYDYFIERLYYA